MVNAKIKRQENTYFEEINIIDNQIYFENNSHHKLSQVNPDVPINGTVYGTLLNYKESLESMKDQLIKPPYNSPPRGPILYIKPKNTYTPFSGIIPLPKDCHQLEIGASLGIVIGKTANKVSEENAYNYIEGYTIVNDVSVPHDNFYRPVVRLKAHDNFCPIGPWIVYANSISNPDDLKIRVYINNETVQEFSTKNLVRSIPKLIEDVTDFMTLFPGDLLMAGKPEQQVFAKAGDIIKIEIDEIGYLENKIVFKETL